MIGCDVRNITSETLQILSNEEVIAVNQGTKFLCCCAVPIVFAHFINSKFFILFLRADSLGVQGRKVYAYGPDSSYQVSDC